MQSHSFETVIEVCCIHYFDFGAWGGVVVKGLRYWSGGPGIYSGGVTWDFFRGTADRTACLEVDSAS